MAEPLSGQDALRLVLNVLRRVTDKDDRQRVISALNEMFPPKREESTSDERRDRSIRGAA